MRVRWIHLIWVLPAAFFPVDGGHPGDNEACPEDNTVLSGDHGFLEVPIEPLTGKYPGEAFCVWEFDVPEDKYVSLKFTRLDVELSVGCNHDRVEIYDAQDTYQRFCGSQLPNSSMTLAAKHRIYVNFISDDFLHFSGFRIEYQVVDSPDGDCSGLRCRNHVCVPSSNKCDGTDHCGDATDEENCPNDITAVEDALPDPNCGRRPSDSEARSRQRRVVGGQAAVRSSWPWMISFQNSYAFPSGHICGGALINRRWILTAAHCVNAVPMSQQKVVLGGHFRYQEIQGQVTRYPEKTCIHPRYKQEVGMQNDVALVMLSVRVNYSASIGPVCLPEPEAELPPSCVVTGWGRTQGTGSHDILKQVEVPVLSKVECGLEKEFCLQEKDGRNSACYGDSGGPVVQKSDDRWRLFGLISRGAEICGFRSDPTVCTEVTKHLDWIRGQMEAESRGKPMECGDL